MKDYNAASPDAPTIQPERISRSRRFRSLRHLLRTLDQDWRAHKYIFFGAILLLLTASLTVLYYLNYPRPELNVDTAGYLEAVRQLQTNGNPVHPWRLPVYPLLIVLIYVLTGQGNLMAVSIVQGALFVLTALEFYLLAILLFKRGWLALLLSLLVGSNLILLSYSKPIMTEGLSLWLLTTILLLAIYFLKTKSMRVFWLVTACLLLLLFTRPEWVFLPILLYAYLLIAAVRQGLGRRFLPRVLLTLAFIYALLGGYATVNAIHSGFFGLSFIENMNLLGKVLQYNMQDEAPPQYQHISATLDTFVAKGERSPYYILSREPELARDFARPAGEFARTIILRHPAEFLLKSVPYFFSSLTAYYPTPRSSLSGPFDDFLTWLLSLHRWLYASNALFPYCAFAWLFLLCWRRTRQKALIQEMGLIVLVALYALSITTLGGYYEHDYMRVHIIFQPLIILTIWGVVFNVGALTRCKSQTR